MTWLKRKYWEAQAVVAWSKMGDPEQAALYARDFFGMGKPHVGVIDRLTRRIEHHKNKS